MSVVKHWCPLLVVAVVGAACHHLPPPAAPSRTVSNAPTVPARPPAPPPPPRAAARPAATAAPSEAELFRRKSLSELNAERPLSDVFFEYDQDVLREDARRVLQRDAEWLAKWPQTRIRIDGQCDERGTAEYNLALGDRRAGTVRAYLTDLGVKPERIQMRSLGKEAPYCHDETESCWSQNRRGHFEITDK
jgi:peptidoglycan-associated lipoprotein